MRQYKTNIQETVELDKIICNKCGKEIKVIRGVAQEDYLEVTKRWGYFSNKDTQEDCFRYILPSVKLTNGMEAASFRLFLINIRLTLFPSVS